MRSMAYLQSQENTFISNPLPDILQTSSIEDFYIINDKLYYVGNYSGYVSELGSSLSNSGGFLVGYDGNKFESHQSLGLPINYEGRHIDKINNNTLLIIGNNNDSYVLDLDEKL